MVFLNIFQKGLSMYSIYQQLLDERGLKNADISRATGISNMTLSDWKNGKSAPKQDKLMKIADYFGVSLDYLMTGEERDYLYSDENSDLLLQITNELKSDPTYAERMVRYMSLLNEDRKTVDDMIDFMYEKEKKEET